MEKVLQRNREQKAGLRKMLVPLNIKSHHAIYILNKDSIAAAFKHQG
jgi:hypothetical protein